MECRAQLPSQPRPRAENVIRRATHLDRGGLWSSGSDRVASWGGGLAEVASEVTFGMAAPGASGAAVGAPDLLPELTGELGWWVATTRLHISHGGVANGKRVAE